MWKNPFFTFSNVRKGFPRIFQCEERISSHFPMWGNPFLTLKNVKKGFPHILNVWNWLKWISSHFSTHSSELEKSKEKFLTFFQCVEFRQTLFSLHQFHTCGKFLTFSWHFPDIFLTLKFHSASYPPSPYSPPPHQLLGQQKAWRPLNFIEPPSND